MERIIVVFDSDKSARRICEMIESAGAAECQLCRSGGEARRAVAKYDIDLVICGFRLPDGTGESLFEDLPEGASMLMIAPQHQLDLVSDDIFRLPAPISRSDLVASVRMVLQMSHRLSRLVKPRRSSEDQDVIRRAKELLMERNGLTEEQAHRMLQKKSMDSGVNLVQTARLVLGDL
ncbi:MAG: ANTAR domain-containing protein [Clostridiales bacterium]|nr:ANTAR domain-containing protein [Clostridiales bacterium]MCD7802005.1 ANTAR domain-containing protein [Clostridiales bacterium]MCD8383651.1 ANTAR domain-containing protein [Clostridiales bacterium]